MVHRGGEGCGIGNCAGDNVDLRRPSGKGIGVLYGCLFFGNAVGGFVIDRGCAEFDFLGIDDLVAVHPGDGIGQLDVFEGDGRIPGDNVGGGVDLLVAHIVAERPVVDLVGQGGIGRHVGKVVAVQDLLGTNEVTLILVVNGKVFQIVGVQVLVSGNGGHFDAGATGCISPVKRLKIIYLGQMDDCRINSVGQVGGKPLAAVFAEISDLIQFLKVDGYVNRIVEKSDRQDGKRQSAHIVIHRHKVGNQVHQLVGGIGQIQFAGILDRLENAVAFIIGRSAGVSKLFDQSLRNNREEFFLFCVGGFIVRIKQMDQQVAEAGPCAGKVCFRIVQAVLIDLGGSFFGIELALDVALELVGGKGDHCLYGVHSLVVL